VEPEEVQIFCLVEELKIELLPGVWLPLVRKEETSS